MSFVEPIEKDEIIQQATNQLSRKYAGKFDSAQIVPVVQESYESFADAKVRTFIAVFTKRYADDRLRAMAKNLGLITDAPPSVLFVCVHNAGRSQMAAGFMRELGQGRVEVLSAGSAPKDSINPIAVEAMAEVGIDIANNTPKVLTTEAVEESDAVITIGISSDSVSICFFNV